MPWVYNRKEEVAKLHHHVLPDPDSTYVGSVFQCGECKEFFVCIPPGDYYSNRWDYVGWWNFKAKRKIREWEAGQ